MKIPTLIAILVLTTPLSGCIANEDSFIWPEAESWDCSIEVDFNLSCSIYLEDFKSPVLSIIHPYSDELWIVEQTGEISSWDGSMIIQIANISALVSDCHVEQGLLGLAFDDDFENSGAILLSFVEKGSCDGPNDSNLVLAQAKVGTDGKLEASSIEVLIEIVQPYRNHNGGHLLGIGNNQFLWGIGDGGSGFDPDGNGQDPSTKLGSILIFSFFDGEVYPVLDDPVGDPFVLHYGLRNPWKFDMDDNGGLWIADVGQNCWEEVNLVGISDSENLGWPVMEGFHFTENGGSCDGKDSDEIESDGYALPIMEYPHSGGNCSITGGLWLDSGPQDLVNGYVFGDFCSGSIWIIRDFEGEWETQYVGSSGGMIVGFGQNVEGNLLIFLWTGEIIHIQ